MLTNYTEKSRSSEIQKYQKISLKLYEKNKTNTQHWIK